MSASSLGTLTLDLLANTGGFVGPLEQAERAALRALKGMGAAVDEYGNYTDKAYKKIAQASAQLDASYQRMFENMQREIALYGEVSRVATVAYDIQKGALKNLSDEQKRSLTEQAARLDALDNANAAFGKGAEHAQGSLRGLRGVAQSAGYQLQDVAVQLQAGTGAFQIISQQGSQFASAFGPSGAIVGAVIAVSGALAGALIPSLADSGKAIKELVELTKSLSAEFKNFTEEQKKVLTAGISSSVTALKKDLDDAFVEVIKAQSRLDSVRSKISSTYGGSLKFKSAINVDEEVAAVALAQEKVLKLQQDIKSLQDPTGNTKRIQGIKDETEVIGLYGEALLIQKAVQEGVTGAELEAYRVQVKINSHARAQETLKDLQDETLALQLKNAEIHKNIPLMEELAKKVAAAGARKSGASPDDQAAIEAARKATIVQREKNDADQKAVTLYEQQDKTAKDRIRTLQREIDLFGVSSKAQQLEYDIKSGLVKINGGLKSQQAQEMLSLTKILELKEKQISLDKAAEAVAFAGYDNTKGDLESTKMQYELDKGLLAVNGELTKEYYEQLIANKKIEESKNNTKKIDDYIKGQRQDIEKARLITGEEKLRYDIMNDILYVQGGINSAKAQEILANQRVLDAQAEQLKLADSIKDALTQALMDSAMRGEDIFKTLGKSIQGIFSTLVLKPSLDILTDDLAKSLTSVLGSVGKKDASGKVSGASGILGSMGPYAAVAVAVGSSLISSWNKKQDELSKEFTAEYRQGVQSLGTVLGEANKKSESISNLTEKLAETAYDTLGVNASMYKALLNIESGIDKLAGGIARSITTGGLTSSIKTGVSTANSTVATAALFGPAGLVVKGVGDLIGGQIGGFIDGVINSVSKAIYSKKTSIIDTGIGFVGQTLADVLASGAVEAFSYAEVQTKKKVLGITTSNKVKTKKGELDDQLLNQFGDIFGSAADALRQAAPAFGKDFESYVSQLVIDPQKLSLKELSGDALTKEIENFFSSTLDKWAGVLVGGTTVLQDFQKVGEGAFETVVRLASETNVFSNYADILNLNFKATGLAAIATSQAVIEAAGGFDKLTTGLGNYYQNFYKDSERAKTAMDSLAKQMHDLGYDTVPTTREEFRALVEKIDVTTESGAQLFASMINLSGQFADLVKWTDEANASTVDLAKTLKDAASASFDALSRSIEAEKERINSIVDNATSAKTALDGAISREKDVVTAAHNERIKTLQEAAKEETKLAQAAADAAYESAKASNKAQQDLYKDQISAFEKSISGLSKLFDDLNSTVEDMALATDAATRARRRAAEFEIETAITNAKAGRGVPSDGRLNTALSVLKNNPTQLYASLEEMSYATAVTQNKLKELASLTQNQMTNEQLTLDLLQKQLDMSKIIGDSIEKSTVDLSTKFDEQIASENEAYDKQIASLDAIAEDARKQFDKLTGVDTTLLTLEEAQREFNAAILDANFVNAKAQLEVLDSLEKNAKSQLDALLGIESGIMSVEDALRGFVSSLSAAQEKANDGGVSKAQSDLLEIYTALVDETKAMRDESYNINQETRKNTQETADILRRMEDEALSV